MQEQQPTVLGRWSNGKTDITLFRHTNLSIGTWFQLQRVRGRKEKKKSVYWQPSDIPNLITALHSAVKNQPSEVLRATYPSAAVKTSFGTIYLEWMPYSYGRDNALALHQGTNHCVAVEQEDAGDFIAWLVGHLVSIILGQPAKH